MIINEKTKIAAIIKENKDSIDAIASLAKPLNKLRNPLLRKVLAARVTLAEAAKIGGTTVDKMAAALQPLGFDYQANTSTKEDVEIQEPVWLLQLKPEQIMRFDVRALLEGGGDPLKEIMMRFKKVAEHEALCVVVGFEPVPLIDRLARKGNVKTFTRQIGDTEYHTFFYKDSTAVKMEDAKPTTSGKTGDVFHDKEEDFKNKCAQFDEAHTKTIDVRALEMPGPRMTILEELGKLTDGQSLYVYHKRIPVYLLEDLADMAFEVHIWSVQDKDVRMLLFKAK